MILNTSLSVWGHLAVCFIVGTDWIIVVAFASTSYSAIARFSGCRNYSCEHINLVRMSACKYRICCLVHIFFNRRVGCVEVILVRLSDLFVLIGIRTNFIRIKNELLAPIQLWLQTPRKKSPDHLFLHSMIHDLDFPTSVVDAFSDNLNFRNVNVFQSFVFCLWLELLTQIGLLLS